MQKSTFNDSIEQLVAQDPRYPREAYVFLRESLEFTQKKRRKSRAAATHVSAAELLDGFREFSLQEFGPMGLTVLEHWGITSTGDVGRMVFNLIDAGIFGRAENDRLEDFENGFNFEEAFLAPFRPTARRAPRASRTPRKLAQGTN